MSHKFAVGQVVDLLHRPLRAAVAGEYEIRGLMPSASDGNSEDPSYRIKSIAEKHERVVPESELTISPLNEAVVSPPDHAPAAFAGTAQAATPSALGAVKISAARGRAARKLATASGSASPLLH